MLFIDCFGKNIYFGTQLAGYISKEGTFYAKGHSFGAMSEYGEIYLSNEYVGYIEDNGEIYFDDKVVGYVENGDIHFNPKALQEK